MVLPRLKQNVFRHTSGEGRRRGLLALPRARLWQALKSGNAIHRGTGVAHIWGINHISFNPIMGIGMFESYGKSISGLGGGGHGALLRHDRVDNRDYFFGSGPHWRGLEYLLRNDECREARGVSSLACHLTGARHNSTINSYSVALPP